MAKRNKQAPEAVFTEGSKRPQCPACIYSLDELTIHDYGVEQGKPYFISPCGLCEKPFKYYTDDSDMVVKTKIVERKIKK